MPNPLRLIRPVPMLGILAASLIWALCYPPFNLGPLCFVVFVPAMMATRSLNGKEAFWYHFAGGLVYNVIMYWWLYNVMKVGPALVILLGLLLLIFSLSFFNALLGWLFRSCLDLRFGLLAYPFLWAGLEIARTKGEMSFPWNNMGYALGSMPIFIQSASIIGAVGISLCVIGVNCLVFRYFDAPRPRRPVYLAAALTLTACLALFGWYSLSRPNPEATGSMDISLVQPSILQTKKWDERYFQEVLQKTIRIMRSDTFSEKSSLNGTDLIVLPETAIPDFLRSRPEVQQQFADLANAFNAPILLGALDFSVQEQDKPHRPYLFYNSAFLFEPGGGFQQYTKLHLVPFSERLPFEDFFPVINYVNLGEGDFSPGKDYALWGNSQQFSPSICYEIIYPDFVRKAKRNGAKILINITNDGWFGRSNAPFQHANIARFRAIESGLPIARCANSGISVFYDFKGRILGRTKLFEETVLRTKLPLINRETFYLRYGKGIDETLFWFFLAGLAGTILKSRIKRGNRVQSGKRPSLTARQ